MNHKFKDIHILVMEYIISIDLDELSKLTRYKVADHFEINASYLSEKFKKETGMTLLEFMEFEKMKRAEKLLVSRPDLTVLDISKMIGIEKCKQFRTKFQRIYGIKPGQYRKICLGCSNCND